MPGAILLPRQHLNQPLYPALPDFSNPLTRGLSSLLSVSHGGMVSELISGASLSETVTTGSISSALFSAPSPIGGGTCRAYTGASSTNLAKPAFGNGDCTIMVIANPAASGTYGGMLFKQSGSAGSIWLQANGDEFQGTVSGQMAFAFLQTSVNRSALKAAGATDGNWHVFIASKKSGGGTIYRDSIALSTTVVSTLAGSPATMSDTCMYGGDNGNSTMSLAGAGIALFATWNRALSAGEAASLSQRPWQLQQAAEEIIWITGATAANLSGSSTSTTTTTGALTTEIAMAGAASGVASANGGLTTSIAVTGASLSVATASGALSTAISLIGGASSVTLANGALTTTIALSGAALAQAASAAGLTSVIALAGQAQAGATASGSLTAGNGLSGTAASQTTATGDLAVQITLSGLASAAVLAAGSLTTSIAVAGASSAQVTASGDLTISTTLSGAALAQAIATGSLTTTIALTGSAVGQVVASGDLSLLGSLVADPRYVLKHTARDFTLWHTARDFRI